MAYFNDVDNANSYSPYSTSAGVYSYPFPTQTLATDAEGFNGQIYADPTDQWATDRWSGPMVESSTSLRAETSYESVASATSYTTSTDDYSWPSSNWLADSQQSRYHHSGFLSRDGSLNTVTASETSIATPAPSTGCLLNTVPFDYWGANQSEASTSTFCTGDVNTSHWPRIGPTRTEMAPMEWYRPYGVSRTRTDWYRNANAGPLITPSIPYIGTSTTPPSGGRYKRTADAGITQTGTEEYRASRQRPKRTRLPHGQGKARPSRVRTGGVGRQLCGWVQQRKKLARPPTFNKALATAVEIIGGNRAPFYKKPHLKTIEGEERTAKGSKSADDEYERRGVERRLYQQLSRYYELSLGQEEWTRPPLLAKVLEELRGLPALPEASNESPS